jgi:tetratricopeptide (TPR) repeat protein
VGRAFSCVQSLGAFDAAAPLGERALALRRESLNAERLDVASSLNSLAVLRHKGQFDGAEALLREAIALRTDALTSPVE